MHGVVLRPPSQASLPAEPAPPMKNIDQLMAEADPVRTLSQTGSVRLLKRLTPDPNATKPTPVRPPVPPPMKPQPFPSGANSLGGHPAAKASSPWPQFPAKAPLPPPLVAVENKAGPVAISIPPVSPPPLETVNSSENESPFILKTVNAAGQSSHPEEPPPPPLAMILRRKAKLADVARIVLPPKREETMRLSPPPMLEPSSTVVPPAFPVAAMTARPPAASAAPENPGLFRTAATSPVESPFLERTSGNAVPPDAAPPPATPSTEVETPQASDPVVNAPAPVEGEAVDPPPLFPDPPKVDPEAHKPEVADVTVPKVDPEAHRPPPPPASPEPGKEMSVAPEVAAREKREFHLTNGEHVAGVVLSETPEAVYIEHETLGVVTIPRGEIAKRLVEIILTNGDRIVGDIMAETADMLYVRHAALGMLSVPRSHRSTRVVEAILKDGDRILGEVMTETDTFTVIRSATLGTITVPHSKLAMLNRKVEQIEMKALPPAPPELKDKVA